MLKLGIVGLPNAGKSTLFNALSGAEALAAPYPFSTIDTNKAVIPTLDPTFLELGQSIDAPDLKYSNLQIWDIAGLVQGASQGEGLGNEFLGQMKNCDVLLHVVRITEATNLDSARININIVKNEVALFDHKLLLKPFEKARRLAKLYPRDTDYKRQADAYTKAYYGTRDGTPIKELIDENDMELFHDLGLVSLKSQLLFANIDDSTHARKMAEELDAAVIANAEEVRQLRTLTIDEQRELGFSGQECNELTYGLVKATMKACIMKQVFTVGHLGVGQWIIPEGATAVECALLIHGDMEEEVKGVKVAQVADFMKYKSWATLTKEGRAKVYNASKYFPHDKDILEFD